MEHTASKTITAERIASFVPSDRLGGRHGIVCGGVGSYARGGRGHQRRVTHSTGRQEVSRIVERSNNWRQKNGKEET
jgi:hypothetical protein